MKYIKSIFAVSIVAMAVVGNARASIVSQTNIVGGSNVSVTVPTSGNNAGKVVISATDTKYTTGTTTYSGTTKLYTGTGDATDGTLTQKAIKSALAGKQDKLSYTAENTANKLASGGNMAEIVNSADADTKYPTVKAALAIAQIAAGAVNDKLGQLASKHTVSTALIDNNAVTSAKIADGTIATADLANSSVTTAKIADGAVTSDKILDGTIATADLANSSVTTAKIANLNVTEGKIAANAVTTAKIKDANVTTDKIADSAITSAKIADGTIAEADLSDTVKTKLNATVQTFNPTSATAGKYVTNFTKSGTTVTATTAYVQIPVGSATAPTSVASIWVE